MEQTLGAVMINVHYCTHLKVWTQQVGPPASRPSPTCWVQTRYTDEFLLDLGVVAGGPSRSLFEPLVLLVAAVVLLDEDRRPPALLEALLLVVRPELRLDQDGRLGHLLIESVLTGQRRTVSGRTQQEGGLKGVRRHRRRRTEGSSKL